MKELGFTEGSWISMEYELVDKLKDELVDCKLVEGKELKWIGTASLVEGETNELSYEGIVALAFYDEDVIAILGESDIGIGVRTINEYGEDGDTVIVFTEKEYKLLQKRRNPKIKVVLYKPE